MNVTELRAFLAQYNGNRTVLVADSYDNDPQEISEFVIPVDVEQPIIILTVPS